MNAKSLPYPLRFTKYIRYTLADSKMEYLCGVTRKNCYFLFYKQIIENKWSNYPEINRKDLKFSLDDHASFLKNKVDAVDLSPQEFFAEIL